MADETIIALAADIIVAHLSHNATPAGDVPDLIRAVHGALSGLGQAAPIVGERAAPAVSIRSSVRHDAITCLECGARFKTLKRHLSTDHALTPSAYRERWGLKPEYPLVAPDYAAIRKALAVKIGLGRKRAANPVPEVAPEPAPKPVRARSKAGKTAPDAAPEMAVPAPRKRKAVRVSAPPAEPAKPASRKRKSASATDPATKADTPD